MSDRCPICDRECATDADFEHAWADLHDGDTCPRERCHAICWNRGDDFCLPHRKDWRAEALDLRERLAAAERYAVVFERLCTDANRDLAHDRHALMEIMQAVGAQAGPGSQDCDGEWHRTRADAVRRVTALAAKEDGRG